MSEQTRKFERCLRPNVLAYHKRMFFIVSEITRVIGQIISNSYGRRCECTKKRRSDGSFYYFFQNLKNTKDSEVVIWHQINVYKI